MIAQSTPIEKIVPITLD